MSDRARPLAIFGNKNRKFPDRSSASAPGVLHLGLLLAWVYDSAGKRPQIKGSMKNDMITLARRHVIEGHKIVERQRQVVKNLELSGHDASASKKTLDVFERTLAIFEDHLRDLRKLTEQLKR